MTEPRHGKNCGWPGGYPCREFSTDGTLLGAEIAHTMGTTDEREISNSLDEEDEVIGKPQLTGMPEEQADWEADEE